MNWFKQGLTIICSKRGGEASLSSHYVWLQTVPTNPDAIFFKFVPITSLLTGIPGSGYLSHAINLYLRCKCLSAGQINGAAFAFSFSIIKLIGWMVEVPLEFAIFFCRLVLGFESLI